MNNRYCDFAHRADELSAYIFGAGVFVISLTDRHTIVRYEPHDAEDFKNWLSRHGVRDVAGELPVHIRTALLRERKEKNNK